MAITLGTFSKQDNGTYTGWRSGYPDGAVAIDVATHRRIPWEDGRDFFLDHQAGSKRSARTDSSASHT